MPQFFRFCLWKFLGQSDMWVELEGLARGEFVLCEQVPQHIIDLFQNVPACLMSNSLTSVDRRNNLTAGL